MSQLEIKIEIKFKGKWWKKTVRAVRIRKITTIGFLSFWRIDWKPDRVKMSLLGKTSKTWFKELPYQTYPTCQTWTSFQIQSLYHKLPTFLHGKASQNSFQTCLKSICKTCRKCLLCQICRICPKCKICQIWPVDAVWITFLNFPNGKTFHEIFLTCQICLIAFDLKPYKTSPINAINALFLKTLPPETSIFQLCLIYRTYQTFKLSNSIKSLSTLNKSQTKSTANLSNKPSGPNILNTNQKSIKPQPIWPKR